MYEDKRGWFQNIRSAVKDMTLDEKRLDKQYLVIKYLLLDQRMTVILQALIDCEVFGFVIVNENFTCQYNFLLFEPKFSHSLEGINGRQIEYGDIKQITRLTYNIGNHSENLLALITKLRHSSLMLGIS